MVLETVADWFTVVGLAGVTGSIAGAAINYVFEGRKFRREQQIAHLKERLDNFYSPMIFHFENMRSWGKIWNQPYAYATESLGSKITDMNNLMRSGLRLMNTQVEDLWYEWQPYAVAEVERGKGKDPYPHLTTKEFILRTQRLHDALKADRDKLEKQYDRKI